MAKVKAECKGWKFKGEGDVVIAICAEDGIDTKIACYGEFKEATAYDVGFAFGGLVGTVEDEYPDLARCMRAGLYAALELEVS